MINLIYHEAKEKEPEVMKYGKAPDFKFSSMPEFSKRVWGLQRNKLVVIGARPSNGKTAFSLQLAWDISKDHSVLFMSLESDTTELIVRLFCNVCQLSNDAVRENGVAAYKDKWDWFCEMSKQRKLLITDRKGASWEDVMGAIKNDYKFDVLFLDYIQCVSRRGMSKLDFIEEYIKTLRVMAIEHDFCAVVLSQINRSSVERDPKPCMTGLKNAGFLEEHCLVGETEIINEENGEKHKIKDLYDNQSFIKVKTIDINTGKIIKIKPNEIMNVGKKKCFKVKTASGKEIIVSEKTKFYNGEWVELKDLRVGDKIYINKK